MAEQAGQANAGEGIRVLIIRPSALGDVCRTVPCLVTLRRAMPKAKIDWLVHNEYVDAIKHHPCLDEVVEFPRERMGKILTSAAAAFAGFGWARELQKRKYDIVYDLQGLLRSGMLTRITGARRRVGFKQPKEKAEFGYNIRHDVPEQMQAVDRMLALLAAEGYKLHHDMQLHVSPADQVWLRQLLAKAGCNERPYIVLAPTAKWRCKCWPIQSYVRLAERLLQTNMAGGGIFIVAGPDERDYCTPLVEVLGGAGVSTFFPETTVGQMMALISQCRLLVTNDSAPMHVAVGFDRPITAIFGPTDPALTGPYHRDDSVIRPPGVEKLGKLKYRENPDDQSLIATVPFDQVWRVTMAQIEKAKTAEHAALRASRGESTGRLPLPPA